MPRDVTMPQLGMAQDAGKIVAWLKAPGDAVTKGDALFEVETDKATMEVEAQASGYLTGVTAGEGEDVPVGAVIAQISDSADDNAKIQQLTVIKDEKDELPIGNSVTMPQLGMAQDTGLLVNWLKSPGDAVTADDLLFEVETDKSTMEVSAGFDGYLAATLAEAGQEVPVGAHVAIISAEKPDNPVTRSVASPPPSKPAAETPAAAPTKAPPKPATPVPVPTGGRILTSPKARRLAREQGLDLALLVKAGHPQPFHVADLDALRAISEKTQMPTATAAAMSLTAGIASDGFADFAPWAAANGLTDADALLAGLAGASLTAPCVVAIARFGQQHSYAVPADRSLSAITQTDSAADLILRDLRGTALRSVTLGAADVPVLTLMSAAQGLTITLECTPAQLDAPAAIQLLTTFADRMEHPLHHLL
ncbi:MULTISPECIES: biotin/lipoyl-containing protein [unclassified Yoonia]|uniref:biotin/lipoyl-containing protein n=1 Tax=unclassified Yoonia TaxID=2629118 RepID=UPI002AFFB6A3|nr:MULTISPECIES: biotin/lipoyl-containing protein [unclassified Yoonia]